jgi:hypothetical protein
MVLEFAEDHNKQPVHISRVRPGQSTRLFCPHCQQHVIPETRRMERWVPVPHFVHVQQTCQYMELYDQEDHIRIPLYREFEHAPDPQIVTGSLPLSDLYKLQQDAMRYSYSLFYQKSQKSVAIPDHPSYHVTDRKLFEWTVEKCLLFTLYCVEIQLTGETIYHIGSSDQPEDTYLTRLTKEFPPVDVICSIALRLVLPQMASIEYYFQHRFREDRYVFQDRQILPDYFLFSAVKLEQVIAELQHLQYVTNTRRENILLGILNARMAGKRIGRPPENPARFLRKKKSREIAALLTQGVSIREIHRRTGYARKTIRKVKALLHQK